MDRYATEISTITSLNLPQTKQLATEAAAEIHEQIEMNQVKKVSEPGASSNKPSSSRFSKSTKRKKNADVLDREKRLFDANGEEEDDDFDAQFEEDDADLETNREQSD